MLPPAFLDRVRQQLGPEYEAFLASYHRPRALGLRLNPLKPTAPDIAFHSFPLPWAAYGFWYPSEERPGLHPWHEAGLYYLQEPSAMAPAELLGVEPGLRVLDLCRSRRQVHQLAAKMRGQGLLVCNEYHPKRAKILSQNVERMAISNALVLQETPERLAKRFPGWFHRVLVDAPAPGGMFRKEAAALEDWSPELVEMCARRQAGILDAAAELLAPGGHLVYSTCTFAPQEDEGRWPRFWPAIRNLRLRSWTSPGSPPGMGQPGRGWSIPSASGLTSSVGRAITPPSSAKGPGRRLRRRLSPGRTGSRPLGGLRPGPGGSASGRKALAFGPSWFWAPEELPDLTGLRVLRPGLELGQCRGRAVPAGPRPGPLALQRQPDLEPGPLGPEAARYLAGEELQGSPSGWTLVTVGSLPGVGKGLRRSPEEPLPQGPAAAHLLASHRLVILAGI